MLKALLRVRMAALGSWITGAGRGGKKAQSKMKMLGFTCLMLYAFGAMGFMFWHYFSTMAGPFHQLSLDWLFFSLVGISDFSLMFVGSVFFAKAQLYEAKDNELLLSMPVPPGDILLSRMAMLLVVTVVFSLPAVVPAAIIGYRVMAPGVGEIFSFALLFLLLPIFSLAIASLFGWLLSVLTARVKRKSLFGTILCILIMLLYSFLVAKVNTSMMDIASHASAIADSLGAVAPVYWFGSAIGDGHLGYTLCLSLVFAGVGAVAYALLSKTFISTATTKRGFAKTKYVERRSAASTPDGALLRREFARLGSSSAYIMNAGMGVIMELIAAVALLIKRREVMELLKDGELAAVVPVLFILSICVLATMNLISASSVSLEGQNLWIVRSMPVESYQVLRAKLRVHMIVCLPPALLLALACLTMTGFSFVDGLLLFAIPSALTVFIGNLGLAENLRHPNLDWTNEAQAVKTGFGMLFTMLISWGMLALPVITVVLGGFGYARPVSFAFLAVLVLGSLLIWRWLQHKGAAIFDSLS